MTPSPTADRRARPAAFTLVELLVAIVITVVLVGLLSQLLANATSLATRTNNQLRAGVDGSVALQLVISDLESIAWSATGDGPCLEVVPRNVADVTASQVMMIARPLDSPAAGAGGIRGQVRAIAYRIGYQNAIYGGTTDSSYALYRQTESSQDTFATVMTKPNLLDHFSAGARPPATDYLVGDVIGFSVVLSKEENGVISRISLDDQVRADAQGFRLNGSATPASGRLVRADVSLTILTNEGATRLAEGVSLKKVALESSHTFSGTARLR